MSDVKRKEVIQFLRQKCQKLPTTSELDLLLLCRLSFEVGQRKSGTIKVVNRGEEKVRVHVNVPRSTTFICQNQYASTPEKFENTATTGHFVFALEENSGSEIT